MSVRLRIISAIRQIAAEQQVTLRGWMMICLSTRRVSIRWPSPSWFARLEDDLGIDPFTISEDASFPLTIGDFVRAYENVPREIFALREYLDPNLKGRTLSNPRRVISLTDIAGRNLSEGPSRRTLGPVGAACRWRQLLAALAMLEIDGVPGACCCVRPISTPTTSRRCWKMPKSMRWSPISRPGGSHQGSGWSSRPMKCCSGVARANERATEWFDADVGHVGPAKNRRP